MPTNTTEHLSINIYLQSVPAGLTPDAQIYAKTFLDPRNKSNVLSSAYCYPSKVSINTFKISAAVLSSLKQYLVHACTHAPFKVTFFNIQKLKHYYIMFSMTSHFWMTHLMVSAKQTVFYHQRAEEHNAKYYTAILQSICNCFIALHIKLALPSIMAMHSCFMFGIWRVKISAQRLVILT
jgi:hypothetical protein